MLGFPPIFCLIMSKKLGFRWKVFKLKYQLFLPLFLSHSAENSVVGPYEYVEKLVVDKKFIQQERGYHDFLIKFLTEKFEERKNEPSFAFDA